jgi:hypothetical protein
MDFFKNQNQFSVPEPWLHLAIPNTHRTNIVQYDTGSALIGIDMLSSYTCTNSMQDFMSRTYSPEWTESITGLGGTKQETTGIGTVRWLIRDNNGALHEFILPNIQFIPNNPICILSPQCLAEDLQDEYHKGTGEMMTVGKMVLFWEGRRYKRTICHHPCCKCPLVGHRTRNQHWTSIHASLERLPPMRVRESQHKVPTTYTPTDAGPKTACKSDCVLKFHGPPAGRHKHSHGR